MCTLLNLSNILRSLAIGSIIAFYLITAPMASAATIGDLSQVLSRLQSTLEQILANLPTQTVLGVGTVVATNDAELANAIKNSTGGETIQLAPGSYGKIFINGGQYNKLIVGATTFSGGTPTLSSLVVIESQDPNNPAVVHSIDVRSSDYWHFNNLDIRPGTGGGVTFKAVQLQGDNLAIENSTIDYGDSTSWTATDWTSKAGFGIEISGNNGLVKNNSLHTVNMGLTIGKGGSGTRVINNTVDGIAGDGSRLLQDVPFLKTTCSRTLRKLMPTTMTVCSHGVCSTTVLTQMLS